MDKEMEKQKLIDFKFEWEGRDCDKIAPNVRETARKLVELNLVKVKEELDENGNIVILNAGVCEKQGLVESISHGIAKEDIYSFKFSFKPSYSLNSICQDRKDSKTSFCRMSSCPIILAGYLWYLKNRNDNEKHVEEFNNKATENDVYARNYNELKKMNLGSEIEDFLAPLALPSIKGLRCALIGEEGTDKDGALNKIAEYLYRIGKISSDKVVEINLTSDFDLKDDELYSIVELQDYLDVVTDNDNFSSSAAAEKKANRNNIKKIVNQAKGKYIIINCTPLELKKFFETNSKLPYIFDNAIYFKDYEDERILKMFEENLPEYHRKKFQDNMRKSFLGYLERNRKYFPFKNEDLSLFLAGYVSRKNDIQLPKERYEETTLDEMLSDLIGMNNVKQQIKELSSFLKLQKILEKQGNKIPSFNLHMMFLGNPGTRENDSC